MQCSEDQADFNAVVYEVHNCLKSSVKSTKQWSQQMTTNHLKLTSVLQRTPSKQDSPTIETHSKITKRNLAQS